MALWPIASYDSISADLRASGSLRARKLSQGDTQPRHPGKTAALVGDLAPEMRYNLAIRSRRRRCLSTSRPLPKVVHLEQCS